MIIKNIVMKIFIQNIKKYNNAEALASAGL